jgi:hypothetical protein
MEIIPDDPACQAGAQPLWVMAAGKSKTHLDAARLWIKKGRFQEYNLKINPLLQRRI